MNELLQIVQKFDRFDTAAESVSRLNALLGGPFLNATELVAETDLSKRFEILKNRLDDAGLSFDQMDYYQRKATASAMGLNEQQLALLMRGRIDLVQAPEKSAAELEALADQTAQFNTVMEELAQFARELAISFGPVISGLKIILQAIQKLIPEGSGLAIMGIALSKVFTQLGISQMQAFAPLAGAYIAYRLLTDIFGIADDTAAALAIGVLALGGAMQYLGVSTALATGGLSLLALGASQLATGIMIGFSPSTYGAVMALGAAFLFLAPVMLPVLGPIAAIVAGFAGMALVVTGLVGLLSSLGDGGLIDNFRIVAEEIANIVESINKLSEEKTVKFTTSMTAMAESFTGNVNSAAMQTVSNNVAVATTPETAAATAPAVASGPPAEIKLNITIDGESIAGAINNVEVSNYVKGQRSKLYDSIIDAVVGTQLVSS